MTKLSDMTGAKTINSSATAGERLTITVTEAGRLLGVGRGAAYAAARLGQLPVLRIGRRLLVPKAALARMLMGGADIATDLGEEASTSGLT